MTSYSYTDRYTVATHPLRWLPRRWLSLRYDQSSVACRAQNQHVASVIRRLQNTIGNLTLESSAVRGGEQNAFCGNTV